MSYQEKKGHIKSCHKSRKNEDKPCATWDEQDQRYYMEGEKVKDLLSGKRRLRIVPSD